MELSADPLAKIELFGDKANPYTVFEWPLRVMTEFSWENDQILIFVAEPVASWAFGSWVITAHPPPLNTWFIIQFTANSGQLGQTMYKNGSNEFSFQSNHSLVLNVWQHVSLVFTNSTPATGYMYVNGIVWASASFSSIASFNSTVRTQNFIGKSNWADSNVNAIFDEIKIFSVALNQSQVRFEMQNDYYVTSSPLYSTSWLITFFILFIISIWVILALSNFKYNNTVFKIQDDRMN